MKRRSESDQAALDLAIKGLFEQKITFNTVLGLQVQSLIPTVIRFDMKPLLVGHYQYGRLHGGVISAVLDSAGGLCLMAAIGEKHKEETSAQVMHRFARMGTIDLRTDFLEQGLGQHFLATAKVNRLGGRIASTQMALHNDTGRLIATASAAYVIS
jgi:uncharacterized protein (TIGR00369 family)